MSGFSGRVILEGDRGGAEELLPKALKLAQQLHDWKTVQNMPAVSKAFDLGDGSYCVVADLQHIRSLLVVCPVTNDTGMEVSTPTSDSGASTGVIDVVSGIVTSHSLVETDIPASSITPGKKGTVKKLLLNGFTPCGYTTDRYSDIQRRYRLGIKEDPAFAALGGNPEIIYSEHAHVKPSQYSGAMRKVVQLVLGIGRFVRPTWEESKIADKTFTGLLPTSMTDAAVSGFGLYGNSMMTKEVVLRWDYRFAKTHGISFDAENRPWVIEISTRGVYAMRLFLDPVSTTTEGQARYKEVSPELEEFIDEFGGIPLGIGFPTSVDFEAYKKAGEVVELLNSSQVSAFYSKGIFSSDIGWSFNNRGTEAHNCAVGVAESKSTGNHYRIRINLGKEKVPTLTPSKSAVISQLGLIKEWQINKAKRMDEGVAQSILKIIARDGVQVAMKDFLAITVTPTMTGTASLQLIRSGYLYHPAPPIGQPQIKFPEPLMGGLISFDFGPFEQGVGVDRCDAPMFVCHINDELEIVNYFYDARPRTTPSAENTREECQFTGSWSSTTYGGEPFIAGNFYSNRWDWREEITPDDSVSTYSGSKIGVTGLAEALSFFSMCIGVTSYTHFWITYASKARVGRDAKIAVAIPFHLRDCYYMMIYKSVSSSADTVGGIHEAAQGPQRQQWKLYNFVFHWVGQGCETATIDFGTVGCTAKKTRDGLVPSCVSETIPGDGIQYSVCPAPSATQSQGVVVNAPQWGDKILGSASWPDLHIPTTYSEVVKEGERQVSCELRMICDSDYGDLLLKNRSMSGIDPDTNKPVDYYSLGVSSWWFKFSPDPESGAVPWMGATMSCLGNEVLNYHDDMDGYQTLHKGGPELMHAGVFNCYTGVIG